MFGSWVPRSSFLLAASLAFAGCADDPEQGPPSEPCAPGFCPSDSGADDSTDPDPCSPLPSIRHICIELTAAHWNMLMADPLASVEVPARLRLDGSKALDIELELHGGYARKVPKKSFRVHLKGSNSTLQLFEPEPIGHERMVLQAAWIDPSFLRNKLAMDLARGEGLLAPRVSFARVTVNGTSQGLYQLIERVDERYLRRQALSTYATLYKAETNHANWRWKEDARRGFDQPLGEKYGSADLEDLLRAIRDTATSYDSYEKEIGTRLSLEDFFGYQRVHSFMLNYDAFTKNYYLYHDLGAETGTEQARFRIITWDADAIFGLYWNGDRVPSDGSGWGESDGWYGPEPWMGSDGFVGRILGIPTYRKGYLQDYRSALTKRWGLETLRAMVEQDAMRIRGEAVDDLSLWKRSSDFDQAVKELVAAIKVRTQVMGEAIDSKLADD